MGDSLTPTAALLTFLCVGIAFSTGTSWMNPDPVYVQVCFGAVVAMSVAG